MHLTEPRLAPLSDAELTPEQQAMLASFVARKADYNIFRTMVRHPLAMAKFLEWGNYILSKANMLPEREREIAVLRTGYRCGSGYEWAQHVVIGKRTGLTDAEIARLKQDGTAGWSDADAAIVAACDDLARDRFVSDGSWRALAAHFDERQCMDLVYTVGQYTQVSMLLNSFGVQLDPGLVLDPDLDHRA